MHAKIVWAVAAVWLVLFLASFVVLQMTPPTGDGVTRGLNRIASFMTWQGAAFGLAMVGALLTYRFGGTSGKYGKLVGYVPLSLSVFLIGTLVAIIAFRVLVAPLFS
jgi:hypothetical protein